MGTYSKSLGVAEPFPKVCEADLSGFPIVDIAGMNVPCIYAILVKPTGDLYVGRAISLLERMGCHATQLRKGESDSRRLQYVFNEHGWDALEFRIVEVCSYDKQDERERYWIVRLCPTLNRMFATKRRRKLGGKAE